MFSEPLARLKNETKIKTSLRARGPPDVSGALRSLRILRIGRIGSGTQGPEGLRSDAEVALVLLHWLVTLYLYRTRRAATAKVCLHCI